MLTREMLKREAGDTIYLRGEELYENGSIEDYQEEKGHFSDIVRARVKGSGKLVYNVQIIYSWGRDCIEEYHCECAAYRNYEGMCKHCAAVALEYIHRCEEQTIPSLLSSGEDEEMEMAYLQRYLDDYSDSEDEMGFLEDYRRTVAPKAKKAKQPRTSPVLEKILKQRVLKRTLPITDTVCYGRVQLIPELKRSSDGTKISFLIGVEEGHKYVLKDVFAFTRAIEQNETFSYGKGLTFVHTREAFEEESRLLVDFVRDWVEKNQSRYSRPGLFYYGYAAGQPKLRDMLLTEEELEAFINAMQGRSFKGEIYGQEEKTWRETEEVLPRILTVIGGRDGLNVSVNLCEACRGKQDFFYFQDGKIYRVSRSETDSVQDFLNCFQEIEAGRSLFVADRDVPAFCREVLPSLEQFFTPNYVSFDKEAYGIKEVSFQIYLDAPAKDFITCKLYAIYGEQQKYDLFKNAKINTDRDTVREIQVGQQVRRYFNAYNEAEGRMEIADNENMIYELLTRGIAEFQTFSEVFVSDALKLIKVSAAPRPAVGISLSGDLLELKMTAQDLSLEQLQEILCKYDRKKKYFRLKNGEFINMEGQAIGALFELKEVLDLSAEQIKSGRIELPKYRALYLDAEAREWNALGMERNREFKSLIRNMKTVEDNDFELPESLVDVVREYQKRGFLWIRTLKQNGFGGILADDMGLGKTLQVIAFLLSESLENKEADTPLALIVCPASLVYNWNSEMERFAPGLPVKMVVGSVAERQSLLAESVAGDILITSYDLLKRDAEAYRSMTFAAQIIDEAQYIKNYNTQAARAVKDIKAGFKLALTGTPIENRLSELWSIFDYLMPGYLYSYNRFRSVYEMPIVQDRDETARKRLQKMIRPFVLRRLKKDVLTDLPDKLEENMYARLEGEQQELYDAHVQRLLLTLDKKSDEEFRKNKIEILAELTKLRQLCCDPGLLYEGYEGASAKMQLCMDIVRNAISGGHKILLFSQFTTMLERICAAFVEEGISHYVLTGATSKENRRRLVESFQSDDTRVFCISLKAGGTGLNLTAADIVIHYDPWWNLAVQNQATDRTHRIGQENVVSVYKLIAKGTIEEKIMRLQEKKKELADQLLNAEEIGSGSFSREELLELLQ